MSAGGLKCQITNEEEEEEDRVCSSFLEVLIGNVPFIHGHLDKIIFGRNVTPLHRK